jgi:type VI protein secretion system component VasF
MEQEWTIHRQTTIRRDGQRRWDLAYQCLLSWVELVRQASLSNPLTQQEVSSASSVVCTCIDDRTGGSPDH